MPPRLLAAITPNFLGGATYLRVESPAATGEFQAALRRTWHMMVAKSCYRRIQGSRASRRPSPRKLKASTVADSATAGDTNM